MTRQKSVLYLLILLSFGLAYDMIVRSSLYQVISVPPLYLFIATLTLSILTACLTLFFLTLSILTACLTLFFLLYHGVRRHLELLIILPFLILTSGIAFIFVFFKTALGL